MARAGRFKRRADVTVGLPAANTSLMAGVPEDQGGARLVALMVAYQGGRIEAFEGLYAALAPELTRYFAARAGAMASDLVQDAFLEMHRSRHTYLPPLPVAPWVFGVARNVERRYWRRHQRHDPRRVAVAATPGPGPNVPRAPGVAVAEVEDALRRLPAAGRDAWLLHHVLGLSFGEIAGQLRIETGTARVRAYRAMAALRAMLGIEPGGRHE